MSSGEGKRKRQSGDGASSIIIPAKRQKGISITIPAKRKAAAVSAVTGPSSDEPANTLGPPELRIRDAGMKIWDAVRATRSKEGFEVAIDFLKLPPKRQYPDYYKAIKRPICLDDIKGRLEAGVYPSLKAVKDDFELCFNNAMLYNLEGSPIWAAAKAMQKISNAQFKQASEYPDTDEDVDVGTAGSAYGGQPEEKDDDDDDDDGELGGDDGDYEGRRNGSKKGGLTAALSSRLNKLITKAPKDPEGTSLSQPFLILPIKKHWPQYYLLIKKPIAFDTIQKKLGKNAYHSSAEFAADVELIFSNAFQLNEDNSPVHMAAQALRLMFHKLMSDLPLEFAWTPQEQPPQPPVASTPKIKLRVSQPKTETVAATPAKKPTPVPQQTPKATTPKPTVANADAASRLRRPLPGNLMQSSTTHPPMTPPTSKPVHQQLPAHTTPYRSGQTMFTPQAPVSGITTPVLPPRSPSPETPPLTTIRNVSVRATPSKRVVKLSGTSLDDLETNAPIRCFAVRLGFDETSIQLSIEAEHVEDDEASDLQAAAEDEKTILIHGRKFPLEIKCNGNALDSIKAYTPPTAPASSASTSKLSEEDHEEDDREKDATNGHAGGDDESGSESDEDEGPPTDTPAPYHKPRRKSARSSTRSGQKSSSNGPPKNGKTKQKKPGSSSRVLQDLGQWDIPLTIGTNVLDIKAGGKEGERWRLFVDRTL